MKINYLDTKLTGIKASYLSFVYNPADKAEGEALLTRFAGETLNAHKKQQDFAGKAGQALKVISRRKPVDFVYTEVIGADGAERTLAIRNWAAKARVAAEQVHTTNMAVIFPAWFEAEDAQAFFEGFILAAYKFDKYKSKAKDCTVKTLDVHSVAELQAIAKAAYKKAELICGGIVLARDLVNTPAHHMTPSVLAETAHKIAAESKGEVQVTVYDEAECEEMGMGSFLAVAQGSTEPPKFIHLVYTPEGATESIALVGKGVTFDSGGLSLKPANSMETMKCDMAGAATVLGVFSAITQLKPNFEVHGVIAATENMPSGHAIRPGDIVKAANGTTIEILNTDAEGRLTLADALWFAQKQGAKTVIDLATLTGACVVALGEEIAALYSDNTALADGLVKNAKAGGEFLWAMPMHMPYDKLIEGKFGDIKNIGGGYGGSITAALFLKRFVKPETAWAHLDIAGPAYAEKPLNPYTHHGASGYGVSMLLRYLQG